MVVLDYRLFMQTWPLLQEVFCNVHRAVTLALVPDGDKMEGGGGGGGDGGCLGGRGCCAFVVVFLSLVPAAPG